MAQVLEFKLPDLGEGLTEAEIVRWLVQVGDVVAVDQPVVEVETAKAMVEVPCPYGGVVTARFGEEGTELPVGAPLLTVAVGAPEDGPEGSGNVLVGYGTQAPAARRRRVRAGTAAADGQVRRPGTADAALHARVAAPAAAPAPAPVEGPVPVISPLVRKLARDNDVDLRRLTGSGPDGLILRADVENALRTQAARVATVADHAVPTPAPTAGERAAAAPAAPEPRTGCGSRSRASAAPSPTSSRAAAGRSRTRPAGSTPTRPNSCARGPP